ncbi:hypothetical protein GJAV_G00192180 [Gymnothorax javanicus]|nr:hypothetical protein GJAV_G00192180 [Gymnothorax javanicus]
MSDGSAQLPLIKDYGGGGSPQACSPSYTAAVTVPRSPLYSNAHEELCRLPGRLRINPSLWGKDDVSHWLRWAQKEYALRRADQDKFEMNGKALCLLTKEDFRLRCPSSGDVLYELLQQVKHQRRAMVCCSVRKPLQRCPSSPHRDTNGNTGHADLPGSSYRAHTVCHGNPHTNGSNMSLHGTDHFPDLREHPVPAFTFPVQQVPPGDQSDFQRNLSHTAVESQQHLKPLVVSVSQPISDMGTLATPNIVHYKEEPLNLSHREERNPRFSEANGKIADCRLLWDYIYQLLSDRRYEPFIRWEESDSMVFRVVDPNGLARLWGNHKNRANMTYEKMSRALRHYYKLNIIKKEPGQKLLFRFLKTPAEILQSRAERPEQVESPDHRSSPDFREDGLEVSPESCPSPGSPDTAAAPHSPL